MLLGAILVSCETDFETTTSYEDITVVYGILDQKNPDQFIKINKAFLSETNVLTYATNPDSNQYMFELEVWLEEWSQPESEGGSFLKRYDFDTTRIYNKESGVFYSEDQVVYNWIRPELPISYENVILGGDTLYRVPIWLNEDHYYLLYIRNPKTGKVISSETPLVNDFSISKPGFGKKINFVTDPSAPKSFTWNEATNGKKYEFELRFNYRELKNSDTISKYLILSKSTVNSVAGNSEITVFYWDDSFYNTCLNQIPYSDPAEEAKVKERYTGLVEIIVRVAEKNLSLYLDVNEPSTSIVQEKPQSSNIDNGIGIFSSRYYKVKVKELDDQTVAELKKFEDPDLKFRF